VVLDVAWAFVAEELEGRLDTLSLDGDHYLIVEAGPGPVYVQFALQEDGSVYGEAVSNVYLEGEHRLSPAQEAKLAAIGWMKPGEDGPRCSCCDLSPPNFHHTWSPRQGHRIIAQVAIVTLRCVYGVRDAASVWYKQVPR
jgi:hypothetical protein